MDTPAIQRFLREPLLHFIAIGGLFFLIYTAINDTTENSIDTILITPERISQITTEYNGVWNRMPTDEELDNLIKEEIRSEVYYRDALTLGLDKNDAVVRRRLRQKMEFLTDTGSYLQNPSPSELEAYFTANKQDYSSEPRLAFEQIYLGKTPSNHTVSHSLKTLHSQPAKDPNTLGQHTLLPSQLKLSRPDAIDSVFGKGFHSQIAQLEPGKWAGPVTSVYGTHLVRTLDGVPGRMPPLAEVHAAVLKNWQTAKAKENRAQDYTKRRSHYTVKIHRSENTGKTAGKERR